MDYKILSYLLFYPDDEYLANLKQIDVKDGEINEFIQKIIRMDKYEAMSNYVGYFDNNPSLSLYLFDHIMGDSKERGQALVDLKEHYESHNFAVDSQYMPDYIPLFLEFLSVVDEATAKELLAETYEVMNTLYLRHMQMDSIYAFVFKNLIHKMGKEVSQKEVKVLNEKEIDELWQEQEVVFGNSVKA
ncbi:MAG: nitrate reductase molybdenum cofactor assembly chaperone [Alphaproteobacteria bacterium]|jgi:nitrate reductase delta subunit|nr:nitrate reductase molybdenum cofactor assembly chaperone [Alphaproteobacteria bacterium]